jgi:hypothetical protein
VAMEEGHPSSEACSTASRVKDVSHVAGAPTTASSRAIADVIAEHDAHAVEHVPRSSRLESGRDPRDCDTVVC